MEDRRDASRPALWGGQEALAGTPRQEAELRQEDLLQVASLNDGQRPRRRGGVLRREAAPKVGALDQRVSFVRDQRPAGDAASLTGDLPGQPVWSGSHHVSRDTLKQKDFPLDSPMIGTPCWVSRDRDTVVSAPVDTNRKTFSQKRDVLMDVSSGQSELHIHFIQSLNFWLVKI